MASRLRVPPRPCVDGVTIGQRLQQERVFGSKRFQAMAEKIGYPDFTVGKLKFPGRRSLVKKRILLWVAERLC